MSGGHGSGIPKFSVFGLGISLLVLFGLLLGSPDALAYSNSQKSGPQGKGSAVSLKIKGAKLKGAAVLKKPVRRSPKKRRRIFCPLPVIVIDAGHGGKDPGASRGIILEKNLTLAAAHDLGNVLRRSNRYRVRLVRTDDRFLALEKRVQKERALKADLFISLHANMLDSPKIRGVSIFTLGAPQKGDRDALTLMKNEAAGSGKDGSINWRYSRLLLEFQREKALRRNAMLSASLRQALEGNIPLIDNPERHAHFLVLKSSTVPSVLIEMGFLSNARDRHRLISPAARRKFARYVRDGLDRYFRRRGPCRK